MNNGQQIPRIIPKIINGTSNSSDIMAIRNPIKTKINAIIYV